MPDPGADFILARWPEFIYIPEAQESARGSLHPYQPGEPGGLGCGVHSVITGMASADEVGALRNLGTRCFAMGRFSISQKTA